MPDDVAVIHLVPSSLSGLETERAQPQRLELGVPEANNPKTRGEK